jgi:hypothetical protein
VKTVTPLARERTAIQPRHSRDETSISVRISHRSFRELTAEERCTVLGRVAGLFRAMAEQAEDERIAIAQEELAA